MKCPCYTKGCGVEQCPPDCVCSPERNDIEFDRVAGDALCPVCLEPYKKHPKHRLMSWLNVDCTGRNVKL